MSKIEDLIKEKCPNGVKYKKLFEVTNWDKKFNGVSKDMQINILSYKHVSAEILKGLLCDDGNVKLLSTGLFDGFTTEELAGDIVNEGEVISIPSGGSANIKYYNGKFVDSGNILAGTRDEELYNLKYIFYVLQSKNNIVSDYFRGSGVKHPSMVDILKIDIPIPPIEVQEEIVKILDKFGELEVELGAELEARQSQYEFWRGRLLNNAIGEIETLSDICILSAGGDVPKDKFSKEKTDIFNIPIYSNSVENEGLYGYTNFSKIDKECITIAGRGAGCGNTFYRNTPFLPIIRLLCVVPKDKVIAKYLYYFFQNYHFSFPTSGIPQLTVPMISNIEIVVPSLEEQERIVNILDKFDKLVNDISEGIPAEIEARRKQYEYYRNKLLCFEECELND